MSAYSGDPIRTAVEFQREIVNNVIKSVPPPPGRLLITARLDGRGLIAGLRKGDGHSRLHTVHNVFTAHLPVEMLGGIDLTTFRKCSSGRRTAGKSTSTAGHGHQNATLINFVGERFLREVVEDFFLDRPIVPLSVRNEVKAKYHYDSAISVLNAPASNMYPEHCGVLMRKYSPEDDIIAAKRQNLIAFQNETGLNVNPDAILFYWPSRLDPFQKGVELLEDQAQAFVDAHQDAQIAIVADGIGSDRTHVDILGRIAYGSGGRIAYHAFNEKLSMQGYAAAHDVFGASLYEPCGQIDRSATSSGPRQTGTPAGITTRSGTRLKVDARPGHGNVLFRDYDAGATLRPGKSLPFTGGRRGPRSPAEAHLSGARAVRPGKMIFSTSRIYETLNDGRPLA